LVCFTEFPGRSSFSPNTTQRNLWRTRWRNEQRAREGLATRNGEKAGGEKKKTKIGAFLLVP
jgi:hypothetical protein